VNNWFAKNREVIEENRLTKASHTSCYKFISKLIKTNEICPSILQIFHEQYLLILTNALPNTDIAKRIQNNIASFSQKGAKVHDILLNIQPDLDLLTTKLKLEKIDFHSSESMLIGIEQLKAVLDQEKSLNIHP